MEYAAVLTVILVLLEVKHYFADFPLQTGPMLAGKGIYGNPDGLLHSVVHAFLTYAIVLLISIPFNVESGWWTLFALACALFDLAIHYHMDWFKMKYMPKDIATPEYWWAFGLDQYVHHITYLVIGFVSICMLTFLG